MSARIFNPVLLSEIRQPRTPINDNNVAGVSSGFSPISRNLFGSRVDREECRIFVERELERHAALSIERWEFDFVNEVPCPRGGRYLWEPIPERLNITRPVKRERDSSPIDNSHLYHIPLSDDDTPNLVLDKDIEPTIVHINKKQSKITDFLKVTKDGTHQTKLQKIKKSITTPSPRIGKIPKVRRLKI